MDYRIEKLNPFYNDWGNPVWAATEIEAVEFANLINVRDKVPTRVIFEGKIIYGVNA